MLQKLQYFVTDFKPIGGGGGKQSLAAIERMCCAISFSKLLTVGQTDPLEVLPK